MQEVDFILEVESIDDQNVDQLNELELLFINKVHTIVRNNSPAPGSHSRGPIKPFTLLEEPTAEEPRAGETASNYEQGSEWKERSCDDSFEKEKLEGMPRPAHNNLLFPLQKQSSSSRSNTPVLLRANSNESVLTGTSSQPRPLRHAAKQLKRTVNLASGYRGKTALFEIDEMQLEEDHSYSIKSKSSALQLHGSKQDSAPQVEEENSFPKKLDISSSDELSISQEEADFVAISEKIQRK